MTYFDVRLKYYHSTRWFRNPMGYSWQYYLLDKFYKLRVPFLVWYYNLTRMDVLHKDIRGGRNYSTIKFLNE